MSRALQIPQAPNPPDPHQTGKGFSAVDKQVKQLTEFTRNFTKWVVGNALGPIVQHVNNDTSQFSTVASGASIQLGTSITHISGAATITNIAPPVGTDGVVWAIADGAFSLGTGGNIALARGPFTVGQAIKLIYDSSTGKWYPE